MARYALIDTLGLLYRAYFGMTARLTGPDGRPTSALFGFFLMIRRLLSEERPDVVIFGLDLPGDTFRHQAFPQYKAQRERMPDDLKEQWIKLVEILKEGGFNLLAAEGYESDDVIATCADQLAAQNHLVEIFTGDRDLLQMVTDQITVVLTIKGMSELKKITPDLVPEVFGVTADQVVEKKALMGDSSDNIPGVKGIGEKGANDLIHKYGTLENIYANIEEIKGATRKKLEEGKDAAFESRRLVLLAREVQMEMPTFRPVGEEELQGLQKIYRDLEFKTFLEGDLSGPSSLKPYEGNCLALWPTDSLKPLIESAQKLGLLSLDLETTGNDPISDKIVGFALSVDPDEGFYLPVGHKGSEQAQWNLDTLLQELSVLFLDEKVVLLGHNLKFDLRFLLQAGAKFSGPMVDTMIAAFVLQEEGRLGLKALSASRLGIEQTTYEQATEGLPKGSNFSSVAIDKATTYAAQDAAITLALWQQMKSELEKEELMSFFENAEMPLLPVLAKMEQRGIRVNAKALAELAQALSADQSRLDQQFAEQVSARAEGVAVNPRSPKQLSTLFYDILELKIRGKKSTDVDSLETLKVSYPTHAVMFDTLLELRQVSKLQSTYVEALSKLAKPPEHRVHTSYSQVVASTGRLSSQDPNLQNIPIRSARGKLIRKAFVPKEGWKLMKADYSQIELRVLAHLSEEPVLLEAFQRGDDIHKQTAALLADIDPESVNKEQRDAAKRVNFGVIYGMGPYALSQDLGITQQEASQFIKTYFDRLPLVRSFIDSTIQFAKDNGFVLTLGGRKRKFSEINSDNRQRREFSERAAVNTVIQGTAAEWLKVAMIQLDGWLEENQFQTAMLLQVHDELVLEMPPEEVDRVSVGVREAMEGAYSAKVPLKVDIHIGSHWGMED